MYVTTYYWVLLIEKQVKYIEETNSDHEII